MMKWNRCFWCIGDGGCQNQDNEVPCAKVIEDIYAKEDKDVEYLRGRLKLADTIFKLIRLSKEIPAINKEDIIDLALVLFGNNYKDYIKDEISSN